MKNTFLLELQTFLTPAIGCSRLGHIYSSFKPWKHELFVNQSEKVYSLDLYRLYKRHFDVGRTQNLISLVCTRQMVSFFHTTLKIAGFANQTQLIMKEIGANFFCNAILFCTLLCKFNIKEIKMTIASTKIIQLK